MKSASPNRLLSYLAPEDFEWLEQHLERVELERGLVLAGEGKRLQHAFFPDTAVISLIRDLQDGRVAEMASLGREAVVGLFFSEIPLQSFGRYVVQIPGTAWRVDRSTLELAASSRPGIQQMLQRYTELLMILTLQYVACNAAHTVEARCCRWLVATHDRVKKDDLPLTHEALANTLGVQRSTVSEIIQKLERDGLIRQKRGMITITERPALQAAACECYDSLRKRYLQILPNAASEGKSL